VIINIDEVLVVERCREALEAVPVAELVRKLCPNCAGPERPHPNCPGIMACESNAEAVRARLLATLDGIGLKQPGPKPEPECLVVRRGSEYVSGFDRDGGGPTWTTTIDRAARFQWRITADEIASVEGAEVDEAEPRPPTEEELSEWTRHDEAIARGRQQARAARILAKLDEIVRVHPRGQLEHALELARREVP
jgi:hypothetical protein